MLRLNKKVEYALIALLYISRKNNGELTTAKELALRYHIPYELMGKILQQLARENFLQSVQGVKGGYRLKRGLNTVNLYQIVEILDKPIQIVSCLEDSRSNNCRQFDHCNLRNTMGIIQNKLELFFQDITLNDLRDELEKLD
jgi:Rrf2 family protein